MYVHIELNFTQDNFHMTEINFGEFVTTKISTEIGQLFVLFFLYSKLKISIIKLCDEKGKWSKKSVERVFGYVPDVVDGKSSDSKVSCRHKLS